MLIRCYKLWPCVLLFLLMLNLTVAPVEAKSDRPPTPLLLEGAVVIDAVEAKRMFESGQAVFVDTRAPLNFGKGHIKNAVCLPYKEKSSYSEDFDDTLDIFDLSKLPVDTQHAIIFYSHGKTGWKSFKASSLAVKNGYKSVYWFCEGFTSWEKMGFPVE